MQRILLLVLALMCLQVGAQETQGPRNAFVTLPASAANPKATMPVTAWDVVPYQVFDKPFNAGVVAFHETGCKVEFTVLAGGKEVPAAGKTAANPTLNEQTKVWEYWIALDPKAF